MRLPSFQTGRTCYCLVLLGLLLTLEISSAGQRGLPAQDGIPNFGKVNKVLYRGAQPDVEALRALKKLGIKSIIDLRMPSHNRQGEPEFAYENGMVYTNVPLRGFGRPVASQVATVLKLIQTLPAPVYVHCLHGCDRTGTVVACYRIQHDNWSSQAALREAKTYGMSWFERGMRRFVLDFGKPAVPRRPPEKVAAAH